MDKRTTYRNIELGGNDNELYEDVDPNMFGIDDLQFVASTTTNNTEEEDSILQKTKTKNNENHQQHEVKKKNEEEEENDKMYQIQQDESLFTILKKNSSHPWICVVHLFFKLSSIVLYLVSGLIVVSSSSNSSQSGGIHLVAYQTMIILLLAMDFYMTQKISGRFLVGLKWYTLLDPKDPNGISTIWIFQSQGDHVKKNTFDRILFWTTIYIHPLFWLSFLFINVIQFHFKWIMPCVIACTLSFTNLYGFYSCSKDQQARIQNMMIHSAQRFTTSSSSMSGSNSSSWTRNVLSFFINRNSTTN